MAIVVITGASSGIGEAAARALAGQGHKLVLAARRADRLEALVQELSSQTEVLAVPTDVTQPGSLDSLAEQAVMHFGGIDVWVNNAGVGHQQPWWQQSPESLREIMETNLIAPMLGARAALPWMIRQGRGHIINVTSVAGHIGTHGTYSATKFGLRGHTESLRREMAPLGIQVSMISPGFFRTDMTRDVPISMPSANVAGRAIAALVKRPRRERVIPAWYRPLIGLNRHFPGLVDRLTFSFMSKFRQ